MITLFLDLTKAFDAVHHEISISKMAKYGIKGTEIECFKSYLKESRQNSFINGQKSERRNVRCRISLGSYLSPLLFLIFIKDFEGCIAQKLACKQMRRTQHLLPVT